MATRAIEQPLASSFNIVDFAAKAQVWLAYFLITGLAIARLGGGGEGGAFEDRGAGDAVQQVLNLAIYLPSLLFMLLRPKSVVEALTRGWVYSALLLLSVASVLWSIEPDLSVRRVIALLVSTLFVLQAVTYFTPRQFIRQSALVFLVVAVLSALAIGIPGGGVMMGNVHNGAWQGIFGDKNTFGLFCGIAGFTFLTMADLAPKMSHERLVWFGALAITLVMLVFSNARTPLLALIGALVVRSAVRFVVLPTAYERRMAKSLRLALVSAGAFLAVFVIPASVAALLALLGRDMTLTGRAKLWEYAIGKGLQRPWFGAGYKAFWTDKLTFDIRVLHQYWGEKGGTQSMTSNAHNGYIDVWLELGLLGLTLLLIMFGTTFVRSIKMLARTGDRIYLWHVAAGVYVSIYYLTNGYVLMHSVMVWFIAAFTFYSLASVGGRPVRGERSV